MIERKSLENEIRTALDRSRIVALTGPRQSGKTTLARQFVSPDSTNYFDLENPVSLLRLEEPMTALRELTGLVVIDEIQRRPDLFPLLRVLADRDPLPAKFLILGSASPELLRGASESLAGRIERISVSGLRLAEIDIEKINRHWLLGAFPLSFLSNNDLDSWIWRKNYIQSLLERDLPQWGIQIPAATILRFWTILAHYHGQTWNAAEAARTMGVSNMSVQRYLDILEGVFMIRVLQPWHANLKKRQVKSPKIYFRDSGIFHYLIGVKSETELVHHPKIGASWEGYAIEEALKALAPDEAYFWGTHNGAELDLLILKDGQRVGIECKRVDAPRTTRSMQIALENLNLEKLVVLYPGIQRYSLGPHMEAVPLSSLADANSNILK